MNRTKISVGIIILVIAIFLGTYFSNYSSPKIKKNISEKTIIVYPTEKPEKEIPVIYNNPPINPEDYQNLIIPIINNSPVDNLLDKFRYKSDQDLYNVKDYWATAPESLNAMAGDDEDFALLFYSIDRIMFPERAPCYIIGNNEFTGVFCFESIYKKSYGKFIVDKYILTGYFFDGWNSNLGSIWMARGSVEPELTEQDKRIEIREFIKEFMDEKVGYCCTNYYKQKGLTYANKNNLNFLYNEKEFYKLNTVKDFENWIYNKATN